MTTRCLRVSLMLTVLSVLGLPADARAQIYFAGYLGGNATQSSNVSVNVPSKGVDLDFTDVEWAARPFESPWYYGWRFGSMFGQARRLGVELEFMHMKAYAKTDQVYGVSGTPAFPAGQPMNAVVQGYAMSHGLNYFFVNLVSRTPLGDGPAAFIARAGAGPTTPHAESTVLGATQEQYEYAGIGFHASAGLDVRLNGRLSLVGEYKFTYSRPEIDLAAGGTGKTTAATHHVAVGLAFGLSR